MTKKDKLTQKHQRYVIINLKITLRVPKNMSFLVIILRVGSTKLFTDHEGHSWEL